MNTIITEPRTNNYRNMSVVTIVPFRCGTFKYHEMGTLRQKSNK